MKKGVIEIQLNWIYIAIVGGIILLIFINIGLTMNKNSKNSLEYEIINYIDEIIVNMQGNENAEGSLDIPDMSIQVKGDVCHYYSIGKSQGSIEFIPLFSPSIIKNKVISYSLAWDMPFRASYFLYLTSPEAAYVFVNNDIIDEMPRYMKKFKVEHTADFNNQNYYKIRFVYLNSEPDSFSMSVDRLKDATAVKIEQSGAGGKIKYYAKNGASWNFIEEISYFDKPTLIAGIYSEDKVSYECNLVKAFERLNKISTVLKERVSMIRARNLPYCDMRLYDNSIPLLERLQKIDKDSPDLATITSSLKSINTELNKKSCPTIY